MTSYVAGFMFEKDQVALVLKQRPAWQRGKMNGIGGHIEPTDASPGAAMVREFEEETGKKTSITEWWPFAVLTGEDFKVHFFCTQGVLSELESTTDESIVVVPVSGVTVRNSIPNLVWLLPMAQSITHDAASTFHIKEEY